VKQGGTELSALKIALIVIAARYTRRVSLASRASLGFPGINYLIPR